MLKQEIRFGFGKNWERFIKKNFADERVTIAQKHLLGFLGLDNLQGRYFLDVGCGSGLHSFAALRAGAARIVSFDIDRDSVNTTRKLKEFAGNPPYWEVREGSILDGEFTKTVDPADIVYAWGVLHHTGDMWQAMDNAARLMKDDGLFYVALYDYDIQVNPPAEFWLDIKKRYNQGGWLAKRWMELWYIWEFVLCKRWNNLPALIQRVAGYSQSRGMAFYTDVVDWLGGWPMEFAKRKDVKRWTQETALKIVTMRTGEANTEYLLRRTDQVSVTNASTHVSTDNSASEGHGVL